MGASEIEAVVLRRVAYTDSRSVLTVWSRQHGRLSLGVSDGGAGRNASRLRALCQPASLVACMADIRPGRDIYTAREFRAIDPLAGLRSDPLKGLVGVFMADLLGALLRETTPPAEGVWAFISGAVLLLDAETEASAVANFPLWFLMRLARVLGVAPDESSWDEGRVFNLDQGRFQAYAPDGSGHWLTPRESAALALLLRMDSGNLGRFRLTREERQRALDVALEYLGRHFALQSLRSLDTLRAILH